MSSRSKLVADIEALLAAAKASPEELDELSSVHLLGKVETLHYQLDDPVMAMYRQLLNVRSTG